MEQKSIRQMILHSKYRHRTEQPNHVPWLNVRDLWLEHAGFDVGQQIEIKVEDKQLIIKAL